MPVNEFEKQVQQKLDELQLRPSPGVWTDVEKQIRKEKKRRRVIIFWWLLPLLLTGAGAGYYFLRVNSTNSPISNRQPAEQSGITGTNDKNNPAIEGNSPTKPLQEIKQTGTSTINKPGEATTSIDKKETIGSNRNNNIRTTQGADQLIVTSQTAALDKKKKKPTVDKIAASNPVQEAETMVVQTSPNIQSPIADAKSTSEQQKVEQETGLTVTKDSSAITNTEQKKEIVAAVPVPNEPTPATPIKVARKKWQFGVDLRPGISNTIEGQLFDGQKSMDVFSAPNTNPGTSNSFGPFAPPVLISYPEKGFSAALEVFARKSISKRWEFQGGLQYQYLSTYIEVGSRVAASRQVSNDMSSNIAITSYYNAPNTGTGNHNYTNSYHLIGLSAGMSWNIINKKKFTLSWDNGFTYGRLIATNALLFDRVSRSYYQDFSAFRKTQFSLNTGLSFPVWNSKSFTLAIHPFASYTLSPVLKQSEQNMQFVNYGIGFKFLFPQKK